MKTKIILTIFSILVFVSLSSVVIAGNPIEKDREFLLSDPDNDCISTWEEFLLGTDPFNTDSDNDGLPDSFEHEYMPYLNPADSSDAHQDADYEPISLLQWPKIGESKSPYGYRAIRKEIDVWPSNRDITFIQPVFDEKAPHYDNYEEYYRPCFLPENSEIIRYMHTNPIRADTDGDGILDPDDFRPLNFPNGGIDLNNVNISNTNIDKIENENNNNKIDIFAISLMPVKQINYDDYNYIFMLPYNDDK